MGGQGGVGIGDVLRAPESGDAKMAPSSHAGGPWTAASIAALYKARSAVPAEPCRVRQSSGALDGDAESLGGQGGVGFGGVLCGPESGDSRRSPRAADKPPLLRPCRATPEALGLRRVSPLSIRRGAPCLRKLVERVSPLGFWMGTRSLWEAKAGLGLAEFCARPKAAILAAVQGRRPSRR